MSWRAFLAARSITKKNTNWLISDNKRVVLIMFQGKQEKVPFMLKYSIDFYCYF